MKNKLIMRPNNSQTIIINNENENVHPTTVFPIIIILMGNNTGIHSF